MTSIQRIAASLAVSIGLMLPAVIGAEAAPVNATAQKNLDSVSEAASNQVELIGRRGGGREFRHGGGGRNWGHRGGGRRWSHGGGGGKWSHRGGQRWGDGKWRHKYGHRHRHRHRGFYFYGSPFFYDDYYYGYPYYSYYDYGYDDGYTSCYRECREYHGPRYCRLYWRRYC